MKITYRDCKLVKKKQIRRIAGRKVKVTLYDVHTVCPKCSLLPDCTASVLLDVERDVLGKINRIVSSYKRRTE